MELMGALSAEDILRSLPDWKTTAEEYHPTPGAIWSLKGLVKDAVVEIYLGTWCPDSKTQIGRYFKILEKLNSSRIRTTYCGLPRDKEARSAYLPYAKNIVKLPTFIVFVNGREKGRIVETPGRTLEEDLAVLMLG